MKKSLIDTLGFDELTLMDEAMDVYEDNIHAITLSICNNKRLKCDKVLKDIELGMWRKYENELRKAIDNTTMREVKKYIAQSKIQYGECVETLKNSLEFLRLSDFNMSEDAVQREYDNIRKIHDLTKELELILGRMAFGKTWEKGELF